MLALGCGGPDPTEPLPLYTVNVVGGAQLAAPAGSELPDRLRVEVRDPVGAPAKGVAVRFQVITGRGAMVTDTLVATGADGIGTTRLRLGAFRDSVIVIGAVRGQEDRGVTFRVFPTAPAELASVQPAAFAAGDTIVLRGSGLTDPQGADVFFGSTRGRLVGTATDTLLRVVVPPCLPDGRVSVAVRIGVASTNAIATTATPSAAPLVLAPGEGTTVRGSEAGCLRLTAEGQRFVIVPQLASYLDSIPSARPFTLFADVGTLFDLAPDGRRAFTDAAPEPPPSVRAQFEAALRAQEQEIARERGAADVPNATTGGLHPGASTRRFLIPAPTLGTVRSFHVLTRLDGTAFGSVTAKLRYAGTNILIYEDLAAPAPLSDQAASGLGDLFDHTLYGIDVNAFGAESDLDENGRVIVLMSPLVNGLTPAAQCANAGFVPGFFYGVDLDTRNRNSNRAEIFYAFVADPNGDRSCAHPVSDVLTMLPATFVHEFQHMISFNQHVLVRRAASEATWLNEGLSHVAEELGARYFDDRYPAPQGRSTPAALLPDSALPFLRGNIENASIYLANTSTRSVTAFQNFGTLEERGAAWLFLRWLGAQKGDAVYTRLAQSALRGGANVESAAGESFATLFADFTLSLYADSIPALPRSAVPPRLRMGKYALRELFTRGFGRPTYPLAVRSLTTSAAGASGMMVQGTAAYYVVTVPAGGLTIRFTPTFPAALGAQVGVVRISP